MSSILTETKADLGLAEDYTVYDTELLAHINATLATLTQVGVGPELGMFLTDKSTTWEQFLGNDARYNHARAYTYLDVKLRFDPPQVGYVLTAFEKLREEAITRLSYAREDIVRPNDDSEATLPVAANDLLIVAGEPFSQVIRVPGAKNVWPNLLDLEVRAQLRSGKKSTDDLIANLHDYMTKQFDDLDLVVTWSMTGAQTRGLYLATDNEVKLGYFNLVVSDVGTEDSRALVCPTVTVRMTESTTTASGGS